MLIALHKLAKQAKVIAMLDAPEKNTQQNETQALLRDDALAKLEWHRLTAELASRATFEETKELLASLRPWDLTPVERAEIFELTAEMLKTSTSVPVALFEIKVSEALRAVARQATLPSSELLQVRSLTELMAQGANFVVKQKALTSPNPLPKLTELFSAIVPQNALRTSLSRSIDSDGNLLSSASPALAAARARLQTAKNRMTNELEGLLRNSKVRDALQDNVWNVRDGRYVLPVRADRRGEVHGVARGVSSTGATLFIEPDSLRRAHEEIEDAQVEVDLEENRILRALSEQCFEVLEALETGFETLCRYDEITARAEFARVTTGVMPILHRDQTKPRFKIIHAKHPLFLFEKKPVVPNDLSLVGESGEPPYPKVWVLSGPNAGGKTVAMRTVGVAALLAKAGLYVPSLAAEIYDFDDIYVELGDRQSRKDDLSSFSGHLFYMKRMLERANEHVLLLIDEGFVGTDPQIGMALARATLEGFAARGATTLVTTHFSNLKTLADVDHRFQNASMEFESHKLAPTYRLLNGIPGQSYALELAERLGFAEDVLQKAREYQGEETQRLENLLSELSEKRKELETEIETQQALRMELETQVKELSEERREFSRKQRELVENFEERVQKRLNLFENKLTIRERQFERRRARLLRELETTPVVPSETQTTPNEDVSQTSAQNAPPAPRKVKAKIPPPKPKKSSPLPKTLTSFEALKNVVLAPDRREAQRQQQQQDAKKSDEPRVERPLRTPAELLAEAKQRSEKLINRFESDAAEFKETFHKLQTEITELTGKAETLAHHEAARAPKKHPPEFWKRGMVVRHPLFKGAGKVLSEANSKGLVECQFGLIKSKIRFEELLTPDEYAKLK